MKRLFAILICVLLVLPSASAYADGGSALQLYGAHQQESSLDVLLYTKDEQYFSADNYFVAFHDAELPVNRLMPLSSHSEYGTSWVIVAEPAAYESISTMAETLIEAIVSNLREKDNAAVINAVTGEMTEFVRDKTTLMPFVRAALSNKGNVKLFDMIQYAFKNFSSNLALNQHKCLLLITEGVDYGSTYTLSEARDEAARQSVTVYTVGITRSVSTYAEAFKEISSLSRATPSGLAFSYDNFPDGSGEEAAIRIAEQEKNNYVLSADLSLLSSDSVPEGTVRVTFAGSSGNQKYEETLENVKVEFASVTEHEHVWEEATCFRPKTCSICGKTEGEPADHHFGVDGVCQWCGKKPEGIVEWAKANLILCAAGAALVVLLIFVLLISLIVKNRRNKKTAGDDSQGKTNPVITEKAHGKVTVELTNKVSGEKFSGDIHDSTLKAGRSAELRLSGDASISREHMEFVWQNGILYVQDTNATNGTWVNGARLRGAMPLHQSDVIHAGDSDFIVNWYSNR